MFSASRRNASAQSSRLGRCFRSEQGEEVDPISYPSSSGFAFRCPRRPLLLAARRRAGRARRLPGLWWRRRQGQSPDGGGGDDKGRRGKRKRKREEEEKGEERKNPRPTLFGFFLLLSAALSVLLFFVFVPNCERAKAISRLRLFEFKCFEREMSIYLLENQL